MVKPPTPEATSCSSPDSKPPASTTPATSSRGAVETTRWRGAVATTPTSSRGRPWAPTRFWRMSGSRRVALAPPDQWTAATAATRSTSPISEVPWRSTWHRRRCRWSRPGICHSGFRQPSSPPASRQRRGASSGCSAVPSGTRLPGMPVPTRSTVADRSMPSRGPTLPIRSSSAADRTRLKVGRGPTRSLCRGARLTTRSRSAVRPSRSRACRASSRRA